MEYKVDIFDSQHNTSSGWTTNTCWQPSELNYQYDTYQWHVKARDPLLAESNWSETRSFRIEAPNKPPSISFNAANSNTASTILSREGTWTFTGTASDPEGDLRSIEFKCTGFSCGTTTSHTNGNNWSHTQTGLNGENSIQFIAHDGYPNHSYSRKVTLLIDQAPPTTQISLDGKAVGGSLANWYTAPVQVNLKATDGGIGKALAGVKLIRYRLDSDVDHWTEVSGDNAAFVVNTDGTHTLDVYSEDQLGNAKTEARLTFKIDQTPPPAPSGTLETNGALDATWQNTGNLPGFTWDASVDATSGLWGYQLYFGSDPAGIGYQDIPASQPREWTPMPGGVPTGTYYLRGRARDFAGNWSAWTTMFTYRYDGTPPENPANVTHAKAVESTVWQRVTSMPNFFWSVPEDKGSGIQGYLYYWGMEEDGTGTELLTDPRYSSPDGLCPDSACTGYLRLRSLDNVGNQAGEWTTAYVLRYDNAPPTVDFTINGGEGYTSQTQITLNITASDLGSGVKALRFSRDNLTWYDWESFTPTIEVTIPPISRTSWPVYIQVKDGVGNVSEIIRHEVALDVNKEQSQSESFRLFDYAQVAGSGELDSANFDSHGTLGQPLEAPITSSENFVNASGYEGGSQAAPVIVPGYETFTTINGAFVTGNGVSIMVSSSFRMMGATGETALPNNEPNLTSAGFSHQPGFLAAAPSIKLAPEKTAGTPPEPEPQPECTLPSVVINNGAAFTNQADVTLALCAPNAVEMLIANSQDMTGAVPQPYAREISWQLDSVTQEVQARFVYVIFKDAAGNAFGAYMDDITFDQTVPSGALLLSDDVPAAQVAFERWLLSQPDNVEGDQAYMEFASLQTANDYVQSNPDGSINLMVDAMDNNSGLVEMQFSDTADFTGMAWEAFAPVKTLTLPDTTDGQKIVYARFRDSAGNISEPALISFLVDRRTPYGSAWFEHNTVQPDVRQINLEMFAGDDFIDEDSGELIEAGSGVAEMRIGLQPDLSDAAWQPFVTPVSWPVELAESYSGTVYVQFRDLAGNESEITNAGYQVDLAAPQLYASLYQGSSNTHQLIVDAWDDLGPVKTLYISNDPLMENDVVAVDYMGEAIDWTFDSQQVVWIAAEDMAGNRSASYPVQAGSVAGQQVQMTWGWNLVSFAVEPTSPNIKSALETIDQSYDLVLSETGVFATSLPEAANSLTQLHAGSAYYIRRTGYTNTSARIAGQLVDPQTPIQLHQGWNWVGYLPGSSMPVTDALASIAGKYSLVHSLDLTFSPDEPVFSTLTSMEPGQGYLIYMNADGVLTYPTPPAAQSPLRPQQIEAEAEETALAATPYFTVIYGQININGQPAPAGTQVQVVTPRGEVAGTFTITNPGIMGYTHIYGVPESETGGFHEGEELQFIVNGMNVEPSTPMVWSDDHDTHAFQLSFNHLLLYMPFVKK